MQHKSQTLKVTIAGRLFVRLLTTLASGNRDRIERFVRRDYAASTLDVTPVERVVDEFMALYEKTGGLEIHKVYFTQRFYTVVIVKARKDNELFLAKLKVDSLQPHGIIEFLYEKPPEET